MYFAVWMKFVLQWSWWLTFSLVCSQPQVGDVFIGYHADTSASIILQVCQSCSTEDEVHMRSLKIYYELFVGLVVHFMPLPPSSVGGGMYFGCLIGLFTTFICLFVFSSVHLDRSCYHSISWSDLKWLLVAVSTGCSQLMCWMYHSSGRISVWQNNIDQWRANLYSLWWLCYCWYMICLW